MTATVAGYRLPAPLATGERLARRVLRLEHGANVLPLGHVLCWAALVAAAVSGWLPATPPVGVAAVVVLTLLNFSLTIGVLHMHAHRPLFADAWLNRVVDVACCLPAWLTAAEMHTVHVVNHHRNNDGPLDVTSTATYERGARAVWYWVRYGTVVRGFTARHLFAPDAGVARRRRRRAFVLDLVLVTATVGPLTVALPGRMLVYYWIPCVLTQLSAGYFAWLTHAPARGRDDASSSINTVDNLLNFFIFNQGYHSVHHRYPGIHWTEIPDRLGHLLTVDPDVLVPYWVTMHTAWRVARPDRFRDARFGARWQRRLAERIDRGRVRGRVLPWFAWI